MDQLESAMMDVEVGSETAPDMEAQARLQEEYIRSFKPIEEGQIIQGTVIQVANDNVFVDIGYKSEGKVPLSDFQTEPKPGDVIDVLLEKKEGSGGAVEISKKKADHKIIWKKLKSAVESGETVDGKIAKLVKGGCEVDLGGGIKAFLPASQADIDRVENLETLIGTVSKFYVERIGSENGRSNVVVNRRKYLVDESERKRAEFFSTAKIGDVVEGTVKSFTSFGAFIDLGGFDGLLHINDMSWGHVTRPRDFVKKGEKIKVKVINLDPEGKRINLSLKHFTVDPWVHFEDDFHVNDIVKGKVTKLTDFGAFIELKEGIEGLAHISEFSWVKKVAKPSDMLKIGDEVDCMILGYDIAAGRVSLGLKQATPNPWDTFGDDYPVGTRLTGKVVKLTSSGAYIRLPCELDAFLHAEDYSWTRKLKNLSGVLSVGNDIDVMVLDYDREARKIRVGVKQLTDDPWRLFAQNHNVGEAIEGEVTSVTDFGIFLKVDGGIEGLVNKQNILESKEETFEDAIKKYHEGDKVKVSIIEINPDKQKVSFSVREYKRKTDNEEIARYMSDRGEESGSYTLGDMLKDKSS